MTQWGFDKCFITGCDEKSEWQVKWFIENFEKHNHKKIPIVFANFGVSKEMDKYIRSGQLWYNSGVVGFKLKPLVLYNWVKAVKENATRGDQETLHIMLKDDLTRRIFIEEIPNEYNWLRVQVTNDNQDSNKKKIMHWTGQKGKLIIREKIKNGLFKS